MLYIAFVFFLSIFLFTYNKNHLSKKKKCYLKSDRHMHVADMRCAGRSLIRGVWGACSQENFYYQHGFLDF